MVAILTTIVTRADVGAVRQAGKSTPKAQAQTTRRVEILSQPTLSMTKAIGTEGSISVAAVATLLHKSADQELVWHAKVFQQTAPQADGNIWRTVWEHRYSDQVFMVPKAKSARPTFEERIAMQPGSYTVQVEVEQIVRPTVDPENFSIRTIAVDNKQVVVH